jgi:hypothetical protein
VAYSKSRVDRAGQTIAELLRGASESKPIPEGQPSEALEAIEIVEWWRSEHARPLSRVAANLRYYAADQGKPVVAQRLKKFPTIAGKLLREPSMKALANGGHRRRPSDSARPRRCLQSCAAAAEELDDHLAPGLHS